MIKKAEKPVPERVKAKVVNVPIVDTLQSECNIDTGETECSMINFRDEGDMFIAKSDMNTPDSVVPEKIGQTTPFMSMTLSYSLFVCYNRTRQV